MKTSLITISVIATAVSNALAHPGPIGHTHGDEWPFKLIAALAITIITAYVVKKFVLNKKQS